MVSYDILASLGIYSSTPEPNYESNDIMDNIRQSPSQSVAVPGPPILKESRIPAPCGIKRSRAGRPILPIQTPQPLSRGISLESPNVLDTLASESESELEDSSSDSDSELAGKPPCKEFENDIGQEQIAMTYHEFQCIKKDLLESSYAKVRLWIRSVQYTAPPDDRLPPRKRARTLNSAARSVYLKEDEEDQDEPEFVIVSHGIGYFHLACPFYVSNEEKYRGCLLLHDLQSVEDVIQHLQLYHMEPPYCPMCYQSFDRAPDRDNHVRERACEFRDTGKIEGVNEYQLKKMAKRDKLYLGERIRWGRIWRTIFPNAEPSHSPYLEKDAEREISMIRDYWETYGVGCVLRYLTSHGLLLKRERGRDDAAVEVSETERKTEENKQTPITISNYILEALLNKVYQEHDPP